MLDKYSSLHDIDLVILAGGKGSRIKKLLGKYPKPMLRFNEKHFIQYILNNKSKYNFKRIIILCGFRSNILFKKFHKKKKNLTEIVCLQEKKLLGTGGALSNLKKLKVKNFVLTNGDTIFDININLLVSSLKKDNIATVALTQNKSQASKKLNSLSLTNNKIIFKKSSDLMNGGVYLINKKIFKLVKKVFSNILKTKNFP